MIIKPYNGWASKNIFKVTNEIELNTVCNPCKNDNEYKVYCFEKYIDGEEFSVETFSQFGIHKVIAVTKKFKNYNFVETVHCIPANLEYTRFNCIRDKVIEFLCGINHMNGPMHTEIIITKDQKVHIVESHL